MKHSRLGAALLCAVLSLPALSVPARAQESQPQQSSPGSDWFVPNQGANRQQAGQQGAPARGQRSPAPPPSIVTQPPGAQTADQSNEPQPELPPPPALPQIQKGSSPPAAVIGVLGVQDIMRASTAAQEVDRVLSERRQKLAEDAKKEQDVWKEMQQGLANQKSGLNEEQRRAKETDLQARVTTAQKDFRERDKIIQDAARYSYAQIERTLVGIIRQVSDSRGMNLILHRPQVALNANEFDITEQVTQELNQVLPHVVIPPDGVEPAKMAQNQPANQPPKQPAGTPPAPAKPAKH